MKKDFFHAIGSPQSLLAGMVALIIFLAVLPEQIAQSWIEEGAAIETASAVAWLVIVPAVFVFGKTLRHYTLASLPLFFGMRELDLHKEWTADSVLKSKYWLTDLAATGEKMIVGVILVAWLIVIILSLRFYAASFLTALRARRRFAINMFAGGVLLFISKVFLDGIGRKMASFGVEFNAPLYVTIAEEVMELTAALLVLSAAISLIKRRSGKIGSPLSE